MDASEAKAIFEAMEAYFETPDGRVARAAIDAYEDAFPVYERAMMMMDAYRRATSPQVRVTSCSSSSSQALVSNPRPS